MYTIVFAGVSRTGKSTAAYELAQRFVNAGKKVMLLQETAQPYLDAHDGEKIERYDMQRYIATQENARIHTLAERKAKNEYDIVIIDRSYADRLVYVYWALLQGELTNADVLSDMATELALSKTLYDEIICFEEMLVIDKNFADYNLSEHKMLFVATLQSVYGAKLKIYTNKKEFEKELDIFVKKYIE